MATMKILSKMLSKKKNRAILLTSWRRLFFNRINARIDNALNALRCFILLQLIILHNIPVRPCTNNEDNRPQRQSELGK